MFGLFEKPNDTEDKPEVETLQETPVEETVVEETPVEETVVDEEKVESVIPTVTTNEVEVEINGKKYIQKTDANGVTYIL